MSKLYNKYKKDFPNYNVGGSVATAAFNVCLLLKFNRIILIGQDLAYSGDVTHAGGVTNNVNIDASIKKELESKTLFPWQNN